jgi:hypothetical protein
MDGLVELRRGLVLLIALAVGMSSSAFSCPRADSCPEMSVEAHHSCCDGDGQGRPAPESKKECPGDCCRAASDLPGETEALPAPALAADALLPAAAAALAPRVPEAAPVADASPPGRTPVPVFLLVSALLI